MGLKRDPLVRLMEKVKLTESGCWQWTHYIERTGYARLWVDGRNVNAHRWSYEYHVAAIPEGLVIDHLCRNRACVNPWHLEPVTTRENVIRGIAPQVAAARGAKITHCPKGHELTPENTYTGSGGRVCVICKKANARAYYERNRQLTIERSAAWRLANLERSRELTREAQRRVRAKKKAS